MSGDTPFRRAVVTGATGLLGSNIVLQLLAGGSEVVAVVRDRERGCRLLPSHPRLRLVVGDVTRVRDFAPDMADAEVIFHTAAYFREYYESGSSPLLLEQTNVTAVGDLVDAAVAARIPVMVHVSSSGVLGPASGDALADEETPAGAWSFTNGYFASKVRAEELIHERCKRHEVRVPIVLPGWMWGPGDGAPTSAGRMFLAVANGQLSAVPRVSGHLVDARDVATACIRAAGFGSRRYLVAGPWRELPEVCAGIARLVGVRPPRAVPPYLALAASSVLQWPDRLRGRQPLANPRGVRLLIDGQRRRSSSERAQRELGVSFRPLSETLADEAAWFRAHSRLPPFPDRFEKSGDGVS